MFIATIRDCNREIKLLKLFYFRCNNNCNNKYDVLTKVSTHTYNNKYVYSLKQVRALTEKRSLSEEHSNIFNGNTTATLLSGKPYEQLPIS